MDRPFIVDYQIRFVDPATTFDCCWTYNRRLTQTPFNDCLGILRAMGCDATMLKVERWADGYTRETIMYHRSWINGKWVIS